VGSGEATHCYSTGAVSGNDYVGGLVGSGAATHCYSTGAVSGASSVGGLIGSGSATACIWDIETSGLLGSDGGVGLNTSEMKDLYMLGLNGFANDPNWILDAGRDYPRLAWEGTPGQIIPEAGVDWMQRDGTAGGAHRIDTADQLILLGKASVLWDRYFVLGADIDLDPNLLGRQVFAQAVIPAFKGVFDGNDHTISHLTINGGGYLGLFGTLNWGAKVRNLRIVDVNITGSGDYIGGLAGDNGDSIANCCSNGLVSGTGRYVGGLVGRNREEASVADCYSTGAVSGGSYVGGLVGSNSGSIATSYSRALVSGDGHVAGLVGYHWYGRITASYSSGSVSGGGSPVGGLVGSGSGRNVSSSFWDIQTSGQATSAGGTGKTTAQMQTAKTFLDAGWDFMGEMANGPEDIWWILEGKDYPHLWWELIPEN